MAPSEFSAISDVKGSDFISDHKIISCVVDFPSLDTPIQKVVTFRQYHKLNIDKFRSDLLTIPFVSSPSDDIDLLHEQYMSGLSGLLDIHAPEKTLNTPDLKFFTQTRSRRLSVPFKLSLILKSLSLSRNLLQKLAPLIHTPLTL